MSTTEITTEAIEIACEEACEQALAEWVGAMRHDAPTTYVLTVDGVTVTAEIEGDPDGSYVTFDATVNGSWIASGSLVDSTLTITVGF